MTISCARTRVFSNCRIARLTLLVFFFAVEIQALNGGPFQHSSYYWGLSPAALHSSDSDIVEAENEENMEVTGDTTAEMLGAFADLLEAENRSRDELKTSLLQLGASYDRGFGASSSARKKVEEVISSLEALNPENYAARGISGNETSPLEGSWRMVWTDAPDVLVLGASPVATVGAIYQVFDPPVVTNIIDLIPRAQALLPPSLVLPTLFRAQVTTRASVRPNKPMRIGLDFEKVQLKPVEILGQAIGDTLPALAFDLPKIKIPGGDPETSPGYFDVTFLDEEMVIIRQNAPGGMFVLVKVPENDP